MRNRSIISNRVFHIIVVVILMFPLMANSEGKPNLVGPTRIYVDADATGSDNGTDWTNAYVHLQDALDVTNANESTDYEIWVAEGVYYPDEENVGTDHTDNDQTESFTIEYNNLRMYGGFSGVEISEEQRDWVTNPTILSGDIDGTDTNTDGNNIAEDWNDILDNNAYHVVFLDGETNTDITSYYTRVDGFTITAGQADATVVNPFGGGIFCAAGSTGVCSPTLRNLTIQGNRAQFGGGIVLSMNNAGVSSPLMTNVSLVGNLATDDGGGFYSWLANDAAGESIPPLVNVSFRNNYAGRWGGGMRIFAIDGTNSPTLTNVEFYGNEADMYGGGMSVTASTDSTVQPILTNVTFSGNTAVAGGGLHTQHINSLTFGMELNNSILWGNIGTSPFSEIYNQSSSPEIISSDIQGCGGSGGGWVTACGTDNGGNIDLDPQFVNPGSGDLSLQGTSLAIDAGDQTLLPIDGSDLDEDGTFGETLPLDLAMNPRVENSDVDMGAYEYGPISTGGMYSRTQKTWYLKDANNDGWANVSTVRFGSVDSSWLPVEGDWNGDGSDTIGMYSRTQKTWYLKDINTDGWGNVTTVRFGSVDSTWLPVVGDWDGDGTDTIGMYSRTQKTWYLKDANDDGWANVSTVRFGSEDTSWLPVEGDWNGDGTDTIGMYSRTQKTWYLKDANNDGWANVSTVRFGSVDTSWIPVVGDWDGDSTDTIGMYSRMQKTWYLKDANNDGWGDVKTIRFGSTDTSWVPVSGKW